MILVRHGRTAANAGGILAGRSPGVNLDETGVSQAESVGQRLSGIPLAAVICSPLERTRQTAERILTAGQTRRRRATEISIDDRFAECDYGDWTGQPLKTLAKKPLWKQVQGHPSSVTFPGGESMIAMQSRATSAIREWNETVGEKSIYAVVSHGDVIKAILADALGMHLDQFQRLAVDPCSVSIIQYTTLRPFVLRSNDSGSDLGFLARKPRSSASSDAAVGGGAGNG